MIKVLEQAIAKVRALPEERQRVAAELLEELVSDELHVPSQLDQAWRDLIDARLAGLNSGEGLTFDFDEALSELRRK